MDQAPSLVHLTALSVLPFVMSGRFMYPLGFLQVGETSENFSPFLVEFLFSMGNFESFG